jgi:thiamine pyrophosphate-dependent acetolactate synthase large subunit-like protein
VGEVSGPGGSLARRAVVAELLQDRADLLVVTGLGSPSYDVMAAGDHDLNYYLWAAMGSAMTVGLGLATTQPDRPVMVLTGDGEALMGFGALATIALRRPRNLSIVILDNGHFGETGMQPSHAGQGIEFTAVAAACGFPVTDLVTAPGGVAPLRRRVHARESLNLAVVKIAAVNLPRALPPRDAVHVKNRFRLALGHQPA